VSSTRARVATSVFDRDIGSTSVRHRFAVDSTPPRRASATGATGDRSNDFLSTRSRARTVDRVVASRVNGRSSSKVAKRRKAVAKRSAERHSTTRPSSSPLGRSATASAKSKR